MKLVGLWRTYEENCATVHNMRRECVCGLSLLVVGAIVLGCPDVCAGGFSRFQEDFSTESVSEKIETSFSVKNDLLLGKAKERDLKS